MTILRDLTMRFPNTYGEYATRSPGKGNEFGQSRCNTDRELSGNWRCDLWVGSRFVTVASGCQLVNPDPTVRMDGSSPGFPVFRGHRGTTDIAIDGGLFVRQRFSSEPDRYRGRRRVPTPP